MSSEPALWFGRIPDRWSWGPLGGHFTERRETVSDQLFTPLSVTKDGIVPQLDTAARTNDGDNRKRVAKGDFVINSRSDRKGSSGLSMFDGSVSVISTVITPRASLRPEFVHHLLRSAQFQEEYYRYGTGIVADLWSTRYSQMKKIPIPVPPVEEQQRIAEFLDRETAQIDELIAKQEQLISTLAERQAELRLRAVTRGLREGASLVESGVPWLGKTPDHWLIGGLGRRVRVTSGFPFKSDEFSDDENDWRLLRGVNIGPQRIKWDETVYWARTDLDGLYDFELEAGDLVLGLDRPIVSDGVRVARLGEEDVPALLLQRVARVRPSRDLDVEFLMLVLSSRAFVDYLAPIFTGVSVPHMSPDQLKQFTVAFPPIAEQLEIAALVRSAEKHTSELIHTARRFVETLQERRQALISAAVTGQIDVGGTS